MSDLTEKQASKLETVLDDHKKNFISNEFNANGVKGVYWTDLSRRPAEIKAAFRYEEVEGITGIQFLETSNAPRMDHRIFSIGGKIRDIIGSGMVLDFEMRESEIIRNFGLFGREKADIGEAAWASFVSRLEKSLGNKDAKDILDAIDKEQFVSLEAKRLALPFLQFESLQLHKDAVPLADRPEVDWSVLSFYGKNDQAGLLRRQAAEIYPIFMSYFARNSMFARRVIQKQQPLNAALADRLGIKETSLKRVQKKQWDLHGLSPEEVGQALSAIPADWIPQDEGEWESFCILTKTVGRKFGIPLSSISDVPFDALYKGAKGKWREFHERCVLAIREDRPPQGLSPQLADLIERRIKKDKKALNKALNKGEADFAREVSKIIGRFDTKGIDEEDLMNWMKIAIASEKITAPEGFNPEFADLLVGDVTAAQEDLKAALKADDGSFSIQAKDILGRYILGQNFKNPVQNWVHNLFHPDMSETFLNVAVNAARDMTDFVAKHVVFPAAAHAVIENGNTEGISYRSEQRLACIQTAMQLLLLPEADNPGSGKSFPNFLEVVRDFQQNYDVIAEEIVGTGPDLSSIVNIPKGNWVPAFSGEVDLGNGIYSVCLTAPKELQDEGRHGLCEDNSEGNQHCVGGYAHKCKNNFHHIISFRKRTSAEDDAPFERIGTLEIANIALDKTELKEAQFYQRGNRVPHQDALAARDLLFMKVRNKDVKINHEQISAFKAANGVIDRDVVEAECHYKWKKKENITNAMFSVGRMIHSGFTKGEHGIRDVDGLIKHPVMDHIVKKMDPVYEITGEGLRMSS